MILIVPHAARDVAARRRAVDGEMVAVVGRAFVSVDAEVISRAGLDVEVQFFVVVGRNALGELRRAGVEQFEVEVAGGVRKSQTSGKLSIARRGEAVVIVIVRQLNREIVVGAVAALA